MIDHTAVIKDEERKPTEKDPSTVHYRATCPCGWRAKYARIERDKACEDAIKVHGVMAEGVVQLGML